MAHWSGARTGFNTRGGTVKEHLAIQREQQLQVEREDADSDYWKGMAVWALDGVAFVLGEEDYRVWWEMKWPNGSIDGKTWKEIYECAYYSKPAEEIECTCNGVNGPCEVCKAYARLKGSTDEEL